jgi:hypothetical protein
LTLLTSPVSGSSISEDNTKPAPELLPVTSPRTIPTRPTVRVQPYPRQITTIQQKVFKTVSEMEKRRNRRRPLVHKPTGSSHPEVRGSHTINTASLQEVRYEERR